MEVGKVGEVGDGELPEVIEADKSAGLEPGAAEGRQEQRGEERNDRDHDQQFDQGEGTREAGARGADHGWTTRK